MRVSFFLCLLVACACGDDSTADVGNADASADAGASSDADAAMGATALFDRSGLPDLMSIPWPSDLYRDDEGRIVVGDVPGLRGGSDTPAFAAIRRQVALRDGFCTTCAIAFAIEGELDPTSIPTSATPFDGASLDDPILLIDVDPDSPELGRLVPLRVHYGGDRIAVRPVPGHRCASDGGRHARDRARVDAARGERHLPSAAFRHGCRHGGRRSAPQRRWRARAGAARGGPLPADRSA